MEYHPKGNTLVLENLEGVPVEIIGLHIFKPKERKIFNAHEIKLYTNIMPEMPADYVHMGCLFFAVEVDGKRYEYVRDECRKYGGYYEYIKQFHITELPN